MSKEEIQERLEELRSKVDIEISKRNMQNQEIVNRLDSIFGLDTNKKSNFYSLKSMKI